MRSWSTGASGRRLPYLYNEGRMSRPAGDLPAETRRRQEPHKPWHGKYHEENPVEPYPSEPALSARNKNSFIRIWTLNDLTGFPGRPHGSTPRNSTVHCTCDTRLRPRDTRQPERCIQLLSGKTRMLRRSTRNRPVTSPRSGLKRLFPIKI